MRKQGGSEEAREGERKQGRERVREGGKFERVILHLMTILCNRTHLNFLNCKRMGNQKLQFSLAR